MKLPKLHDGIAGALQQGPVGCVGPDWPRGLPDTGQLVTSQGFGSRALLWRLQHKQDMCMGMHI